MSFAHVARRSLPLAALLATPLVLPTEVAAQFLPSSFRTIDGSGNNLTNPDWGAANRVMLRAEAVAYADGQGAPAGASRPNPRAISNAVCAQSGSRPNARGASDMLWQWGQFIDHDLDLVGEAAPTESFPVAVPIGDSMFDPFHTGTQIIDLHRSKYVMVSDGAPIPSLRREQVNSLTSFLDGSMVYGSDAARALELRALDGTGRLKTGAGDLMPFNVNGFPNAPSALDPTLFLAGDERSNEQSGLAAMHTLFVREHNFWADLVGQLFPATDDEMRYQAARAIVGAEIQAITYREWLPVLLGPNALTPYAGYDPNVDATVRNVFAGASFRLGHSLLSATLMRLDGDLDAHAAGHLPLRDAFFVPNQLVLHGIDPLLRGLVRQRAQELDVEVIDDVRNFLFGPPGAGGLDLPSLNIQRGRDHGLCSYNQLRVDLGLPAHTDFSTVSSDPNVRARLASVYASVDDIDAWVGGLAEDHLPGAMVGPTIHAVLRDQFERARDGDRFYYEHALSSAMRQLVEEQTLARIMRRNCDIDLEVQDDAFRVFASIVDLAGGCGTAGLATATGGAITIGNATFALALNGASLAATQAVLHLAAGPDSATIECGTCRILVPEFATAPSTVTLGSAITPLPLPNDPAMTGLTLQAQYLVVTPGTTPCLPGIDVSASNRVEFVIGE